MTYLHNAQPAKTKNDLLAAFSLFLLALALRLPRLFDLDVWFDEVVLIFQVNMSFSEIWNFCKTDNFPPLFPWLLKIWHEVFPGANSLRLFSAILGALTPAAAYFLGKEIHDRRLGWMLGIACVLSAPLLYYSQMIRMYALFPFFTCLSITGFLGALRTQQWKYWVLMAAANLLGFYTFLFMGLLMLAEIILLSWHFRLDLGKYKRFLMAHAPAFLLGLLWVIPLFQRFGDIQGSFRDLIFKEEFVQLWPFLGTGRVNFGENIFLAAIFNLPLLGGFVWSLKNLRKNETVLRLAIILVLPPTVVALISWAGQPIFDIRYFLFLVPVYLSLVFLGWLSWSKKFWRLAGVIAVYASLITAVLFYFHDYLDIHKEYRYMASYESQSLDDGHALSRMADFLQRNVGVGEVIIHYSNPTDRVFSFFPSRYYHGGCLHEYLYSPQPIPAFYGRQYLRGGEQIQALQDLQPAPAGLWLISLDSPEIFSDSTIKAGGRSPHKWMNDENLVHQLVLENYLLLDAFSLGRVTALHYQRLETSNFIKIQ